MEGMGAPRTRWWTRLRVDDEDRGFIIMRVLLVLVAGTTGVLLSAAGMAAEAGGKWWPWLVGAGLWVLVAGAATFAVWWRLVNRRPG